MLTTDPISPTSKDDEDALYYNSGTLLYSIEKCVYNIFLSNNNNNKEVQKKYIYNIRSRLDRMCQLVDATSQLFQDGRLSGIMAIAIYTVYILSSTSIYIYILSGTSALAQTHTHTFSLLISFRLLRGAADIVEVY